jgi:hypothetical protein
VEPWLGTQSPLEFTVRRVGTSLKEGSWPKCRETLGPATGPVQEASPAESPGRHILDPGKTPGAAPPPEQSNRPHHSAPPRPPPLPATRAALCGRPNAKLAAALGRGRSRAGSLAGPAVYTGREGSSSAREGTGDRDSPAGGGLAVAHALRKCPAAAGPRRLATWRVPSRPPPQATPPAAAPAAACATKFLWAPLAARLTCEARHERAEPEEAGVQGRGRPRHGGRRARRGPGRGG